MRPILQAIRLYVDKLVYAIKIDAMHYLLFCISSCYLADYDTKVEHTYRYMQVTDNINPYHLPHMTVS